MIQKKHETEALKKFRTQKVINLDKLVSLLKCSKRTIKRRLKCWGVCTSYNQNSSYYVLPDIPKFNQYGIWKYRKIFFSKYGNLKETFNSVIDQSVSGLDASEMSGILGLPAYTFLSHYKNDPNTEREKYNGLYIYFSKTPDIFKKQKREREEIILSKAAMDLPPAVEAVTILVEFIKHSQDNVDQLTHRVRRKGVKVSIAKIHSLLVYHNLLKKNPDFQSFEH